MDVAREFVRSKPDWFTTSVIDRLRAEEPQGMQPCDANHQDKLEVSYEASFATRKKMGEYSENEHFFSLRLRVFRR